MKAYCADIIRLYLLVFSLRDFARGQRKIEYIEFYMAIIHASVWILSMELRRCILFFERLREYDLF